MLKLGQQFGVGKSTVQDIIERRTWMHLSARVPAPFRIRDD